MHVWYVIQILCACTYVYSLNLFEIDAMSYQIIACHVNYQIMFYMLHCVLSWCIVSSYVKSYDTLPYILLPH